MAILSKVSLPITADHLEVFIKNFHETYSDGIILFETVVPIPGKTDLYRFIVVYNDSNVVPSSISEDVVINDDTKGE